MGQLSCLLNEPLKDVRSVNFPCLSSKQFFCLKDFREATLSLRVINILREFFLIQFFSHSL